ncbi:MAG: hypothetical protein FWH05_03630 [Oscillospiraceae bacterium]|nr:hypothetical protein [Oscillospiraceae bacterium]
MNKYFLGGMTAFGFSTKFGEMINAPGNYTYILKGGPGTGKSTLMKKVAAHFKADESTLYYCASDLKSVDAVSIKAKTADNSIIIVDGTSPHVFEAQLPGVAQCIINLGDYWHKDKLEPHSAQIRALTKENQKHHRRARRLIAAFTQIKDSVYEQARENLKLNPLEKAVARLMGEHDGVKKEGKISYKQLSAMTERGYMTLPVSGYKKIAFIDKSGAAAVAALEKIAVMSILQGYDIILSKCEMYSRSTPEHILIPDLKLMFSCSPSESAACADETAISECECAVEHRLIDCQEFYLTGEPPVAAGEPPVAATEQPVTDFGERPVATAEPPEFKLLETLEAGISACIKDALKVHDELEKFYIAALDTQALENLTQQIISEIAERAFI